MRLGIWLVVSALVALLAAPWGWAATASPSPQATARPGGASFEVEGKVLQRMKGAFVLSVTRVRSGGLKAGIRLRIGETSRTKYTQEGKSAKPEAVKSGETVRVVGVVLRSGKAVRYQAQEVVILR